MKRLLWLLSMCLISLLTACSGGGGGGTTPSLVVSPKTATLAAGTGNATFNATLSNATGTINWALSPNLGTLSATTGTSVTYTPPATVASTTSVTLTATSGSLSDTATITINPPTTITVAGKVLKFNGDPIDGVSVQVRDSTGAKPLVLSNASGDFSVSGVQTPYTLSVVPNAATGLLPVTYANVTRTDPKVVVTTLAAPPTFCTLANSTLNITLSAAVGAGNTGRVYFVGDGVSIAPLISFRQSGALAPGATNTSISITHDNSLCVPTINGKALFIERDGGGTVVKVAIDDVSVTTGNVTNKSLTVVPATSRTISGSVAFPSGITSAQVVASIKVNNSYVQLQPFASTATASPNYTLAVVDLPGIQYRVTAIGGAFPQQSWEHSDILNVAPGNLTGINLSLASLAATVGPVGAINTTTPTFSYTPVSGKNFYYTYMAGGAGDTWLGATTDTSITLPSGLPAPARNAVGSAYAWYALNAINVRNPGSNVADAILDGRLVKHSFFYNLALYEPDQIASGSLNFTATNYNIIP